MGVRVLGLDPALASLGWAILEDEQLIDYGIIATHPRDARKQTVPIECRLATIYTDISELLAMARPVALCWEKPWLGRNTNAGTVQYAIGAMLAAVGVYGATNPLHCFCYKPAEIKLQIAGSGKATKPDIREALEQRLDTQLSGPDDGPDAISAGLMYWDRGESAHMEVAA